MWADKTTANMNCAKYGQTEVQSAAERAGNLKKANYNYQLLTNSANSTDSNRPELESARLFLKREKFKS